MSRLAWGLTALLCLTAGLSAQDKKETDPDKARVTIDVKNAKLMDVIELVKKRTGIPVEYDAAVQKQLEEGGEVSFAIQDLVVSGFYKLLLGPHGLTVTVVDKKKILISAEK